MGDWVERFKSSLPVGGLLSDQVWESRHRGFLLLLWLEAAGLIAFGLIRGYNPGHAVFEGGVVAVAALVGAAVRGRTLQSAVVTTGLLSASAVLVHLSGGTIEAHFHFFVVVTLITLYQEWTPFLLSIAYVVIHHGLVGVLDPNSVYNHAAAINRPVLWAVIHGGFIFAASGAGLIVWKRNEALRLEERAQALELHDKIVQGLVAADISLELGMQEKTGKLIQKTLRQAQDIVSDLLEKTAGSKDWEAGDFVRSDSDMPPTRETVAGASRPPN